MIDFSVYDVVRVYRKTGDLMLAEAVVIKETRTYWFLRLEGDSYGAFRNRAKHKRDSYGRTPVEAWERFAAWEREQASACRAEALTRDGYASMADAEIARLRGDSEAIAV